MSDSTTTRPRRHSAGDTILNFDNNINNNNRRSYQDEFIEQEDKPPSYTEIIDNDNDNYRSKKRRKRRWSFTALMKKITPKLISRSRKNNNSSNRSIRTVLSSRPTGDVLDEYQQQDILHQLTTNTTMNNQYPPHSYRPYLPGQPSFYPNPIQQSRSSESSTNNTNSYRRGLRLRGGQRGRIHSSSTAEGEARRIASLDHIWVFRLLLRERYGDNNDENQEEEEEEEEEAVVWTTFDYDNQMKLMNEQEIDKGIEIFDSHIRQGQLPVLVVPKRQRGYFPMDSTGDAIVTLEVACLPNTKDTLFVMRHYSPS
ncbi:hypothetical protein BDC45DRAFT_607771 [Circinella umbellata]|nr:hypothetical protein BDC45DRAFT_607771 [Circinella umbellata]